MVSTLPFIFVFCVAYLFYLLGWTFIGGVLVLTIGMFTNYKISKTAGLLQKDVMKAQDARMNLTTEALQSIKIIKIYGWD